MDSLVLEGQRASAALPETYRRPANLTRSAFHVGSGIFAASLVQVASPTQTIAVAFAFFASGWAMELVRRWSARANTFLMWIFGPVAHPHERDQINSSTWFASALFLLSLTHSPLLCAAGSLVLAFGDPAAAVVGRKLGKHQIVHGRTLEGTSAFVLLATGAVFAWLVVALGAPPSWMIFALALGTAVCGAVGELVSRQVDDNFSVPLAAAVGFFVLSSGLGLPT